jgi:hypothetical protein
MRFERVFLLLNQNDSSRWFAEFAAEACKERNKSMHILEKRVINMI